MRKPVFAVLLALVVVVPAMTVSTPVQASPAEEYDGPYFGDGNLPPGCIRDMAVSPDNICHHMRTDMNGLDSPQIDVLVMVPVSPTAERDMRIMRQSVEMWEGGIDYLGAQMGLDWLADGVDFHITVDHFDPNGDGGEFTTYPIVDPEIVIIATNPVGGVGIGVDPVDFVFTNEDLVPCHEVSNPFDFEYWESLPGFDSHHEARSGTYEEDCGGAGGNICFAVNGAIDPAPETLDVFGLFDLVSHELGHCMTIGHVGDGAEGAWGAVPTNDIMAYSSDPPGLTKCMSTLDVEGVALRMSKYLDVNGDGTVDDGDLLVANDERGDGRNPFQVQHPGDHLYASGTGSPMDCPQPDLGLVPADERTNWTPEPVASTEPVLTVTGPEDGAVSRDGSFGVTGTVERRPVGQPADPTATSGSYIDAGDDASTPITEILELDVNATSTHVNAVITLEDLWPSTDVVSPTSYSVVIDGRKFDSFVRYAIDANPKTWDNGVPGYMPPGTSTWDLEAKTVTFEIPREYLASAGIEAPYFVASHANIGLLTTGVVDDSAPDAGDEPVGVAGARVVDLGVSNASTFEHEDGNTFYPEQSTLGVTDSVGLDTRHHFTLDVAEPSDITFSLEWTDAVGGADLDLYVTGEGVDSGSQGGSPDPDETVVLYDVQGQLDIVVEPWLITDPVAGSTYTLTAEVTPLESGAGGTGNGPDRHGAGDGDGDGVADGDDACPRKAGDGPDGCPLPAAEHVHVYVDGVLAGSQDVDSASGPDKFAVEVRVRKGTHELRIDWEMDGEVVATETVFVEKGRK